MPSRVGVLAFLGFTFASTWLPAWALRDLWRAEAISLPSRVLICSALYVGTMGWQPALAVIMVRRFLEPARPMDAGLRGADVRFRFMSLAIALGAMAAASLLDSLFSRHAVPTLSVHPLAFWPTLIAVSSVLAASAFVFGQCVVEELAWRGYFLVRAMECAGPWGGLVSHGIVWGLWYTPLFLFTAGAADMAWLHAGQFVVTCVLLGIVLGWLRLASRSILPPVTANVLLTLGAGLPVIIGGTDVGARAAVYLPFGWVPLSMIVCWIAFTRHRNAVATPRASRPQPRVVSDALH